MSRYVQTNTRRRRLMLQQLNDDLNMIHGGEVNSSDQNVSSDQSGDVSSDDSGDVSGCHSGDVSVSSDYRLVRMLCAARGDVSGDDSGDVSGDECHHDCANQDISCKLTSEKWKSLSGDYEVLCQLILVQDHSIECPIMQEPTSLCSLDDLPETWTITNNRNEKSGTENSTANTAKLPCSHTFYAPALAMHFLSSNMRCPVCRAGSPERMNVCCVPDDLREKYKAKLATIHIQDIETEIAEIDTVHIINVLSQLQMELQIIDARDRERCLSVTQTRIIFDNQHILAVQNSMQAAAVQNSMQAAAVEIGLNSDTNMPAMQTSANLCVHRSFQRLARSIIGRHFVTKVCSEVMFAITHPLLPLTFSTPILESGTVWTTHFSNSTDAETFLPLYCPNIAGTDSVGCIRFAFSAATNTTNISIDINTQMILNICSYVTDVMNSIEESVELHLQQINEFTSTFPALTQ